MTRTSRSIFASIAALVACLCFVSCGRQGGGTTAAGTGSLGHSVLRVEEVRNETVFDAAADTLFSARFESELTHFGRMTLDGENDPLVVHMYNDSLRLREEHPFRIRIFMSRDTLFARSGQEHGAMQDGGRYAEAAMLECLFVGPAVRMTLGDGVNGLNIDHLKSGCAGGLYNRLDLPKIMSAMLFRIPPESRRSGASWQSESECPSFAGLGLNPRSVMTHQIAESADAANTLILIIACDASIGNLKTTLPNGEEASIVGGRYRLKGRLVILENSWLCLGGSIDVTEEISYVRPALGSAVLEKNCATNVTLAVRWDS